ncbi:MAG: peptide chain release factor N(5)-glutamine methyltransferase [Alphaproteobacteria bacterium]|nr:peptide chain release factor N(5)-glutamine methyltransferase [Alphaproteobacteria bacterium]
MTDTPCADPAGTIGFFLCQAVQRLRGAAIEAPRLEARRLLAHVLGTTEEALLRDPRAAVPADKAAHFVALLARRVAHEPFAYLTRRVGFWTLDLEVSPATLIPRADSESLIEAALEASPDKGAALRVLDLGTGTGALLLAVLAELPAAQGIGLDLKPAAAASAARNAARLGLAGRARFLAGDWAAALTGQFDLVLCNPPYIESAAITGLMPEVARHEPASALDGGTDGLAAYRHIIADLPRLLAPRGVAVLELGAGQQAAVQALGRAAGLTPEACRADLGGVPRALVLRAT